MNHPIRTLARQVKLITFAKQLAYISIVLVLGFPITTLNSVPLSPIVQEDKNDFDREPAPQLTICPPILRPDGRKPYLFGIINDDGKHYSDEWRRGVRATTFELQWRLYEPAEGVYDQAYIAHMQESLQKIKEKGWFVQLIPGYHYVPVWVFQKYPDMYFVNQFGDRYDPDPQTQASYRVINAPFNPQARVLIARYLARVFQDFQPTQFDSVRIGGGVQGELRYPPASSEAHFNSYWAFDIHAQNPDESGIPGNVVGWRPGIDPNPGSQGKGQRLVNPGFELTHPYIPILAWSPEDGVEAEITAEYPHSGEHALKIAIQTPHRIHQFVRVEPGANYRFAGWLKSAGAGQARILVTQYNLDTQLIEGASFGKLEVGDTTWRHQSSVLTTTSSTSFLKFELDGDRPGTFYFDDVSLSREGEQDTRDRDISIPLAFYDWYVQALTDYQNWQIEQVRQYTGVQLDLIYPGKGLMPNHLNDALSNDLRGDGWSESSEALYGASLFDRHLKGLESKQDLAVYSTGIEEPAKDQINEDTPYPNDWSAAHWMSALAGRYGLQIWGENSGKNSYEQMQLSLERMNAFGFTGIMWGFESELYSENSPGVHATIEEYQAEIRRYSNQCMIYLPLIQ